MRRFGVLALWILIPISPAASVEAIQMTLKVANLQSQVYDRYHDPGPNPLKEEGGRLERLEAALDRAEIPKAVMLEYLPLRPLDTLEARAFRIQPIRATLEPASGGPTRWVTIRWDGVPGTLAIFYVEGLTYLQEAFRAGAKGATGRFMHLQITGVPLWAPGPLRAPRVTNGFVNHAIERETIGPWLERTLDLSDNIALVVVRNHDLHSPDNVYIVVRVPETPAEYKAVVGWRDRVNYRDNHKEGFGERTSH